MREGKNPFPEIMIPVVGIDKELEHQKEIVERVYGEVLEKFGLKKIPYMFGTMIEIPRAALTADKIAKYAQFFSFGTNDLTQMGFGFSRDDIGGFMRDYLDKKILPVDPFQEIDRDGIGELIRIAVEKGRSTRPDIKIGICGEHGGDPSSIEFCNSLNFAYVSCSPFRVPIARLASARATVKSGLTKPVKKAKNVKKAVNSKKRRK
jgi:pyruvate,orthophosphate dikinase